MSKNFLFTTFLLLLALSTKAQTVSSTVVDKKTKEPIPYATVQYSEHGGLITNEEGRFSIQLEAAPTLTDSLHISSMGYEKTRVSIQGLDSVIPLSPKPIELKGVFLFDKTLTVDEIMDKVKERFPGNYSTDLSQNRLFFRQSNLNHLNKLDIEFKKSTIAELDKELLDSILRITPRDAAYYTETLADYNTGGGDSKLHIIKAAELYDKNNEGSMEALSEKMEKIFRDNVKSDSFLKIKSGLFGTKVQVDSIIQASEEAKEVKDSLSDSNDDHFFHSRKANLNNLFSQLFFQEDSKINVIEKSNRYNFTLRDYTSIDDAGVYVIDFTPGWRADFKGTLYVNMEDFAVMRIAYQNTKKLRNIHLFGFTYEETVYKGKTIYQKGSDGKYRPKYIEKELGNRAGVDRPLKVIEKNRHVKGKNKQNELSLHLDIINISTDKSEVVIFDTEKIDESQYNSVKENSTVKATYLSKYSPEFWKGYNIMEPNAAIRGFSVQEEDPVSSEQ
ncbi:carboxypeptidase-like regulatory domain-containing protein [Flavobacteriaceae bacterium F89]|uniref:Carboxypeptidase-like regulatory domain-containing protein n=1 Tax=Cerina litoralis TaxID=2874477 RepID=A0AAE3EUH0_9FLAO|nr:carboxypeptidase-like regulatory domain-containing protein [Cerina litoralis]MCG2459861.1 carboxypeptidase-like regulatory domain-containing protein [Cerina litoralis]